MNTNSNGARDSLQAMFQSGGRSVGWWQVCANLAGAAKIGGAILEELKQFQQGVEPADDITLVIVKVGDRA